MLVSIIVFYAAANITFAVCTFFDGYIHSDYLMHSLVKLVWPLDYLRRGHPEHHADFPTNRYKNPEHPTGGVNLPIWAGLILVKFLMLIALPFAWYFSRTEILVSVFLISTTYFFAYNYVHSCCHVPKGRWFERTKLFAYLDRRHHLHHAVRKNNRPVNTAILCNLFDRLVGTEMSPKILNYR